MEILIALTLLWVTWLASPRKWQKPLKWINLVLTAGLVTISPLGIKLMLWGLTVPLPPDSGEKLDAIVVLGRGEKWRDHRIMAVKELWEAQRAPHVFASGMLDARFIVQTLKELGIPGKQLSGEECSQSTRENALFSAALLRNRKIKTILLVTDQSHMLRSFFIFRSMGFQVVPHPIPTPTSLSTQDQLQAVFREYAGLLRDQVTGQYQAQTQTLLAPPAAVTSRVQKWNCRVNGLEF